jgi:choloylglycine hydrolase
MPRVRLLIVFTAIGLFVAAVLATSVSPACTGMTLKPRDGSRIFGRTLEFAIDMQSNLIVVPRGQAFVGSTPQGKPGKRWTTKYGVVGMNAFGMAATLDGMNERGLAVGLFYFPNYAGYQTVGEADVERALAPWEFGLFLLSTCATVDEATAAAESVLVGAVVQADMGMVPPAHFIVSDAAGGCVVLEHVDGALKVHSNPLGVMSNSPTFDWHLTNLGNYVNLTVNNVPPLKLDGTPIAAFGQGSGLRGLPGDFTPPSRFVRAVAFSQSALPAETAHDGVLQAFHLLNQFDIPKGAVRGSEGSQPTAEYTLWTSVADLTNRRYHFRTFADSRLRMVDLAKLNFAAPEIRTISLQGHEQIEDVSE